ncbi:hypothetical protein BJY01DRAFT_128767 [Aspergillus pseudoustus]|uniref:Uncharacterized protein n=1 Tax=Aspergillus pseudoustus TaxID=1810923 RepID=A0ABR4IPJ0_9EURO
MVARIPPPLTINRGLFLPNSVSNPSSTMRTTPAVPMQDAINGGLHMFASRALNSSSNSSSTVNTTPGGHTQEAINGGSHAFAAQPPTFVSSPSPAINTSPASLTQGSVNPVPHVLDDQPRRVACDTRIHLNNGAFFLRFDLLRTRISGLDDLQPNPDPTAPYIQYRFVARPWHPFEGLMWVNISQADEQSPSSVPCCGSTHMRDFHDWAAAVWSRPRKFNSMAEI